MSSKDGKYQKSRFSSGFMWDRGNSVLDVCVLCLFLSLIFFFILPLPQGEDKVQLVGL